MTASRCDYPFTRNPLKRIDLSNDLGLGEDELESPFVSSQCPRIRQVSATKYAKRSTTQLSICARECTGFIDLKQQL